ncbi:putative cytochrome C oxidase assembly factor COX15 [Cardiosporidium cionae]|uniref:Cytochrome C oxidase assembly factor COX15 n=1 Tax=Cardiosporidium cionae TaxID=476202 RepID=A0ABQ7J870_9APIC|nr:putative cytochrome C oxidase assembly factor COX15 [Cardiosporidium cionae]|eukprot:KAF8820190.1 putative cytochrome C oxidase assembly factor COX15 [Cardiosporidium cionae]
MAPFSRLMPKPLSAAFSDAAASFKFFFHCRLNRFWLPIHIKAQGASFSSPTPLLSSKKVCSGGVVANLLQVPLSHTSTVKIWSTLYPASVITNSRYFSTAEKQKDLKSPTGPNADVSEELSRLVEPAFSRSIGYWLLASCGMVLGMVSLGGYTRLSGSGLSMTDWKIQGSKLPNTEEQWQLEFGKYKVGFWLEWYSTFHNNEMEESPEYKALNFGMPLNEFKQIYFIEWLHRMMGRLTGGVFIAGVVYYGLRRAFKLPFALRMSGE